MAGHDESASPSVSGWLPNGDDAFPLTLAARWGRRRAPPGFFVQFVPQVHDPVLPHNPNVVLSIQDTPPQHEVLPSAQV